MVVKLLAQELTLHFHDFRLPPRLHQCYFGNHSIEENTYRDVGLAKNSSTTFAEVIFDRIFFRARSRRGLISS